MNLRDTLTLSFETVVSYRTRSLLIVLAMALGVAAVVVLTALGEGARRYVVGQFSSLGTNLVIVLPGRAETSGGFPGAALGQTPRDLTLEDARFIGQLPQVRRYAPLNVGVAELTAGGRLRDTERIVPPGGGAMLGGMGPTIAGAIIGGILSSALSGGRGGGLGGAIGGALGGGFGGGGFGGGGSNST